MPGCKVCLADAGTGASMCVACGARSDAAMFWKNRATRSAKYFMGDLSGLTEPERHAYQEAFNAEVERFEKKESEPTPGQSAPHWQDGDR